MGDGRFGTWRVVPVLLLALAACGGAADGGAGDGGAGAGADTLAGAGAGADRGAGADTAVGADAGGGVDADAGAGPGAPGAASGADPLEAVDTVRVWFHRGEAPESVTRVVRGAPLPGALRALMAGPTSAERAAGLGSWFSDSTSHVLRSVALEEDGVVVDFRELPSLIPNASTSAGSAMLLTSLDSTVFQFPWVRWAEYRLDGSCAAFWEWLQRSCDVVER